MRGNGFKTGVYKIPRKTRLLKGDLDIAPLIDCVFLLLIFFMLTSTFVKPAGIKVNLPKTVTADLLTEGKFVIVVTSEDIIYYGDKAVDLDELKQLLQKKKGEIKGVLIKADKRASLGRIIQVWDICRDLGIQKLNIATLQMKR
jgi:biopolymer transport protein ExbD